MKRELVDFLKQEFSNRLFDQRSEGTRCISNAIVGWAKVNSLKVFSEYRMPKEFIYHKRKGGPLERPAIIDFVIKKSETSLYIELDSSQKKWSVAKLQQIKNAGGDVL